MTAQGQGQASGQKKRMDIWTHLKCMVTENKTQCAGNKSRGFKISGKNTTNLRHLKAHHPEGHAMVSSLVTLNDS